MKEIKLSEKQKQILEGLNSNRALIQSRLNEIDNQINLVSTLVFDINGMEAPKNATYKDGMIMYDEKEVIA